MPPRAPSAAPALAPEPPPDPDPPSPAPPGPAPRPRPLRPKRKAPAPKPPAAPSPGPELPPAAQAPAPAGPVEPGDDAADIERLDREHREQLARLRDLAPGVTWGALRAQLAPHLARLLALHEEAAAVVGAMRAAMAEHNTRTAAVAEMARRLGVAIEARRMNEGELLALVVHALGVRPSFADWLTPSPDPLALVFRMTRLMGEPEAFAFRDDPKLPEVLARGDLGAYRRRRAEDAKFGRFLSGQAPRR